MRDIHAGSLAMLGPMDPSQAVLALETAVDREQVFELLLRAARSKLTFAALLSVHRDHIQGRRAIGDDGAPADIAALTVPRTTVSVFETAIATRTPTVAAIASSEPFVDGMLEVLRGTRPDALVIPIAIGDRTVALIVGHAGGRVLTLPDVADVLPLATPASAALARLLALRSKSSASVPDDPDYEIEVIVPEPGPIPDSYLNAVGAGFLFGVVCWGFVGPGGLGLGLAAGVAVAAVRSRVNGRARPQRGRRITEPGLPRPPQ